MQQRGRVTIPTDVDVVPETLTLMERLKVIAGNQERNKKRIVEMIVNNAIEKAEKKSMRKLFQSKYDKRGCLILRDKDFEVG